MVKALITALILLLPAASWAACPGVTQPLQSKMTDTPGITVSSTVKVLSVPQGAVMARLMVETNSIRFYDEGTAPTSSTGTLVTSPAELEICGSQMSSFKMIRATGSDAATSVRFYGY